MKRSLLIILTIFFTNINAQETPREFFDAEIIALDPYPVDTISTNTNKKIIFISSISRGYKNMEVLIVYENGELATEKTNELGEITLMSSETIKEVYILNKLSSKNKTMKKTTIEDADNTIHIEVIKENSPFRIDLQYIAADTYYITLKGKK